MIRASVGIGLRSEHIRHAISCPVQRLWFEVSALDNVRGRASEPALLEEIRQAGHAISLHGAGLSLAGTVEPDPGRLAALKRLVDRVEPILVSEHLAWSRLDGRCLPDLLPVPRTNEVLARCARNIERVQDLIGRQLLIERSCPLSRPARSQLVGDQLPFGAFAPQRVWASRRCQQCRGGSAQHRLHRVGLAR